MRKQTQFKPNFILSEAEGQTQFRRFVLSVIEGSTLPARRAGASSRQVLRTLGEGGSTAKGQTRFQTRRVIVGGSKPNNLNGLRNAKIV